MLAGGVEGALEKFLGEHGGGSGADGCEDFCGDGRFGLGDFVGVLDHAGKGFAQAAGFRDGTLALAGDPEVGWEASYGHALVLLNQRQGEQACSLLRALAERSPSPQLRADSEYWIGVAREQLGDPEAAVAAYFTG